MLVYGITSALTKQSRLRIRDNTTALLTALLTYWTGTDGNTRSKRGTSNGLVLLASLFESLLTLLFSLFGCCSLRVSQLRIILEAVEVIMHVPVEKRGMHGLGESINQHVIRGNPSDAVFEILDSFSDIQEIKCNSLFFGGTGWLDARIVQ